VKTLALVPSSPQQRCVLSPSATCPFVLSIPCDTLFVQKTGEQFVLSPSPDLNLELLLHLESGVSGIWIELLFILRPPPVYLNVIGDRDLALALRRRLLPQPQATHATLPRTLLQPTTLPVCLRRRRLRLCALCHSEGGLGDWARSDWMWTSSRKQSFGLEGMGVEERAAVMPLTIFPLPAR
jgi:hypothetical protein